jgi:hypothetical protein
MVRDEGMAVLKEIWSIVQGVDKACGVKQGMAGTSNKRLVGRRWTEQQQ